MLGVQELGKVGSGLLRKPLLASCCLKFNSNRLDVIDDEVVEEVGDGFRITRAPVGVIRLSHPDSERWLGDTELTGSLGEGGTSDDGGDGLGSQFGGMGDALGHGCSLWPTSAVEVSAEIPWDERSIWREGDVPARVAALGTGWLVLETATLPAIVPFWHVGIGRWCHNSVGPAGGGAGWTRMDRSESRMAGVHLRLEVHVAFALTAGALEFGIGDDVEPLDLRDGRFADDAGVEDLVLGQILGQPVLQFGLGRIAGQGEEFPP